MKFIHYLALTMLIYPGIILAEEFSEEKLAKVLKVKIMTARHIGWNPAIVSSVLKQNNQKMSLDGIKKLDNEWKATKNLTPFKLSLQQNEAGLYLKSIVEKNPHINEAFLTDDKGANVAAYPATSDYWQGDEGKWSNSFNEGKGKVFIGPVKVDESTNTAAVQISAPVLDYATNGKTVGVIIIGVTVNYLKTK